ncbi:serine/threonine-protein kinase [Mycobacterium sp. OAS707]|uniref:serine/threonine-protein kinase n=1 Tax=Mycobacterium sp. OAS707 TaxID=2663822 RepID=UPI001789D8FB|nr:serine/threonine-protein kinase [Mycobacterium sp. OAS707]MBE1552248.1 serine/threonine-protein kinase [Mycobacterium sp. OAS707]
MPLGVGSVVAGYRIERALGTGGMGVVYLAKHPAHPRRDALKVLSAELSRDPGFRERFLREADIASMLFHPNIVSVYGRGETDAGHLWIAMQYVEGTDAERALRDGTMTPNRAIHIVREVAKALDYAHDRNVVHHDVKPANFLLDNDFGDKDHVLLSDFGGARTIGDSDTPVEGLLTATLAYAAPEVIAGDPVDGRADLYSLGCTLFRLLTGKQPFYQARGESATARAHLEAAPPRVSDHLTWAPTQLDQVIGKALAKDPAKRFTSAREFANAATDAIRGSAPRLTALTLSSDPTLSPRHRRTRSDTVRSAAPPPQSVGKRDHRQAANPPHQLSVPVINPKPARCVSPRLVVVAIGAMALLAAVVSVVVWLPRSSPPTTERSATPEPIPLNNEAQARLKLMLPLGYPPGRCIPASTPAGAQAVLSCGANLESGGPTSATYTLARDPETLRADFDAVVHSASTVNCPGNIQSPGPWRHNANPTVPVGTLFCGIRNGQPLVAWTNDAQLLLNVVQNAAPGPTLEQLYAWWTTHS